MAGGELLEDLKATEQTESKTDATDFKMIAEKYQTNPDEWKKSAEEIMKIDGIKDVVAQILNNENEDSPEFKASKALYENVDKTTQQEILRLRYEKKVFELGKKYKELTDIIKTQTTESDIKTTQEQIQAVIEKYRTAYSTYETAKGNPINTLSLQQKEKQFMTAYRNNPSYKRLVDNTLETKTYTIPGTPGQDVTTTKTLLQTEKTELDNGKTNFTDQQIADINTMLDKVGDNTTMYIEITGLTDATPYLIPAEIKKNEENYDALRMKYPDIQSVLPTIDEIKSDSTITDKQNAILGYRRVLVSMDNAITNGKIKKEDLAKFRFSSEVGTHIEEKKERGVRIALKEEITEKTPPTPPTTITETGTDSPEKIQQTHDYVKVFALNPNYGKTKDLDPRYPTENIDSPYMFVQLSTGANTNTKGNLQRKIAAVNEIVAFNDLNDPRIDVTNLKSTKSNENVKTIYTFVTPSDVENIIDKNFIGNKDYTSTTNQLLAPLLANNKENTQKALEQQAKSIEIIRYVAAKDDTKLNGILADSKAYHAISRAIDGFAYKKEHAILPKEKEETKEAKQKEVDDDFKYILDAATSSGIDLKNQPNEKRDPSRENNKKTDAIAWLAGQNFGYYQTVKVNGQYMKPKSISSDIYANTTENALEKTDGNLTGTVKRYDKVDKIFNDDMLLAAKQTKKANPSML